MAEETHIFSGKGSNELWKFVNRHGSGKDARRSDTFWALYLMGCRCQELEAIVERQGAEIDALRASVDALKGGEEPGG